MATAAELIAEAQTATTVEELDAIEQQAEGRTTVLQAVEDARERLNGVVAEEPPGPPPPDVVWVGCPTDFTTKDPLMPVISYSAYLSNGFRRLTYVCHTCQQEVFPSVWGLWMEHATPWHEGGVAPDATEVQRWGG